MRAVRLLPVTSLLLLLLAASAPTVVQAQLRPDPEALEMARDLRKKGATAPAATDEILARMKLDEAAVTAVLHHAGYGPAQVAAAHRDRLRLDASRSAQVTNRALGDAALAFAVMGELARSNTEALTIARSELRLSARQALDARDRTTKATRSARDSYRDMGAAGYALAETVAALKDAYATTAEEMVETMRAAGESWEEVLVALRDHFGMQGDALRDVLEAGGASDAEGAEALDAAGAGAYQMVLWIFRDAVAQQAQDASYYWARSRLAAQWIGDKAAGLDAMRQANLDPVAAAAWIAVKNGISYSSDLASATADEVAGVAAEMIAWGGDHATTSAALRVLGVSRALTLRAWALTGQTLDWLVDHGTNALDMTATQIDDALSAVLPVTIEYLSVMLGLDGIASRIQDIVGRLRDKGISAVDIAVQVGSELGMVEMAQALLGAGYGPAQVSEALVEGMGASLAQAGQILAQLGAG